MPWLRLSWVAILVLWKQKQMPGSEQMYVCELRQRENKDRVWVCTYYWKISGISRGIDKNI